MADPQTHAHTNAHHPILEDVDWDDIDATCDHPVPPLPPDLAFFLSHLSTLRLSLGSQGATTQMDDHHIAAFLACMPNLEKLTLRNMISSSSSRCTLRRTVHLPRLRILNIFDGDQGITSLLHHLHITPKVKLDIEIVSLTDVHVLVDVFSKIRRILRGSNDNTQQTLKSLTMVATLQGLVVKGHFDLREFCSMRSPDSEAPIRIALRPVHNREWTNAAFTAIFSMLSISSVRTLILGDLVLNSLTDPVLRVFLRCLSSLEIMFLIETKFNAPPEASYWGAMVFVGVREELGLPVLSYLLGRTIHDPVYREKLQRVLTSCRGVWDVCVERVPF